MDFSEILSKHDRDNDKQKPSGSFNVNIFFLWRLFTQHILHIFGYSNFTYGYLDNRSEYPKSLTQLLIDALRIRLHVNPFGIFTPYWLLSFVSVVTKLAGVLIFFFFFSGRHIRRWKVTLTTEYPNTVSAIT